MVGLPEHGHEPVMVEEVLNMLGLDQPLSGPRKRLYMDCTLGRGGHSVKIAQRLAGSESGGTLIALDVDPANLKYARKRIEEALGKSGSEEGVPLAGGKVELRTFHANFAEAGDVLDAMGLPKDQGVDGLLADFGVSTNQLLETRHGLSFNADLALDMRLDPRIKESAADIVARWDEKELADILHEYAQERFAWRIARKIVQTRTSEPILTTGQLARLVRSVVPPQRHSQIDPATRTFQALRMAVNSELERLEDLLDAVPALMAPNGRAVFISFHSGEDRLVKQAIRNWEEQGLAQSLSKKPLEPADEEMNRNPRSRSAKLRGILWKGRPATSPRMEGGKSPDRAESQ
jgi:16S rRNA (cytosine1402-N4)-methyltransferase